MLKKYVKITDEIKDQILLITEDDFFVIGKDFNRINFRTDDNLPYDQKMQQFV